MRTSAKGVYWIDGNAPAIYRLNPKTNEVKEWKTPKPIGSFAIRANGGAICAMTDGFYFFDFATGNATAVKDGIVAKPGTTFNDGKTDARGRFIAGTLDSQIQNLGRLDLQPRCVAEVQRARTRHRMH